MANRTDPRLRNLPVRAGGKGARRAALALAASLAPGLAAADGFWQVPQGGEPAPGVALEPPVTFASTPPADVAVAEVPSIYMLGRSKLGLAVREKQGRPSFDGLAYQATDSFRISADGEIDINEGEVSGGVKLQFNF